MIDLKQLRDDPDRFALGARQKGVEVDIPRVLALDERRRSLVQQQEGLRAEQRTIEKAMGPEIGKLMGRLKGAQDDEKGALERELAELKNRPIALKEQIQALDAPLSEADADLQSELLRIPMPADADVPVGASSDENVELSRWAPAWWDWDKSFEQNKGFAPKTHLELVRDLGLVDFERGVKVAGARSYVLTGLGMRLHQAVLRYAFDYMVEENGFTAASASALVREESMVGTGFFPTGRDQAYVIDETGRGGSHDYFLAGTGEVGLMSLHQDEILDESELPRTYTTVSPCYRREAGAAGRDTAGLYRIHQFEKVEQVVICKADEAESRAWHAKMIGFVEELLRRLELPHRQLQCCTGDLGVKNADMIDLECWMPGRGDEDASGRPTGAFGETHSASRLYDYQCRRLNLRYRGESTSGKPAVAHSLNNTVIASPRVLIPILEMHQNADGSVTVPEALRPHLGGRDTIA